MGRMEGSLCKGQEDGVRKVCVYKCCIGYLELGVNGLVTYHGGQNDCVWLMEDIEVDDVMKLVQETIREELWNRMVLYNTKYDRNMLMAFQRDGDLEKLVKGNDACGHMILLRRKGQFDS